MSERELEDNQDALTAEEEVAAATRPRPGEQLRERREALGADQATVAESLHLTVHYVNALENDDYKRLPSRTFVKGYFRSYARLLEMDVDKILDDFEHHYGAGEESARPPMGQSRRRGADHNLRWVLAGAVLIVAVAVVSVAWWYGQGRDSAATGGMASADAPEVADAGPDASPITRDELEAARADARRATAEALAGESRREPDDVDATAEPEPPAAEAGLAPAETAQPRAGEATTAAMPVNGAVPAADLARAEPIPAEQSAEAAPRDEAGNENVENQEDGRIISLNSTGDDTLVMEFAGTSWVEVDNRDSIRLYNDNLHEGDRLTIRGEAPFNVLIGDARGVSVMLNTRQVDVADEMREDNSARLLLEP